MGVVRRRCAYAGLACALTLGSAAPALAADPAVDSVFGLPVAGALSPAPAVSAPEPRVTAAPAERTRPRASADTGSADSGWGGGGAAITTSQARVVGGLGFVLLATVAVVAYRSLKRPRLWDDED